MATSMQQMNKLRVILHRAIVKQRYFLLGSLNIDKNYHVSNIMLDQDVVDSKQEATTDSTASASVGNAAKQLLRPGRGGAKIEPKQFKLTFEEFVDWRKKLKFRGRISGIPFGLLGLTASSMTSAYLLPNMFDTPPEEVEPILGLDPILFCASTGVVVSIITFVAGSSLYRKLWNIANRDLAETMKEREKDFLQRIESNRAVRSYNTSKYEDDYYGDTITTLSDYRQWLRKQQQKLADSVNVEKSDK